MEEKVLKPSLRFKGFTDAWEQDKVGNCSFLRGRIGFRGYTRDDLVTKHKGAITFSPSDIDTDGHVSLTDNDYISYYKYEESPEIKVANGDILFTKTASIGKIGYVANLKEKATINPQFALITPKANYNGYFLFLSFRLDSFSDQAKMISGGSSIPTMSQEQLKELTFCRPTKKEQDQIANFLYTLDSLITLHQRKYKELQNVKKSLLQKMFPEDNDDSPKIRFKGFTDPWEQRKVSDCVTYRRGSFPQPYGMKEWYGGPNSKPFVQVVDVSDDLCLEPMTKQRISVLAQPKSIFMPKDTIVVTLQGSIGRVAISQYDAYYDRTILLFDNFKLENINKYFWAVTIKKKFDLEKSAAPGGTIKTITKEVLSDFEIYLANSKEQNKIGHLFKNLDSLITLHQRKCEKLQNIKKSLLERMLV